MLMPFIKNTALSSFSNSDTQTALGRTQAPVQWPSDQLREKFHILAVLYFTKTTVCTSLKLLPLFKAILELIYSQFKPDVVELQILLNQDNEVVEPDF